MNQLAPVTLCTEPGLTLDSYLRQVYEKSLAAYQNGCYDLDALRVRLTEQGHASPDPMLFDVCYNFLGPVSECPAPDEQVSTGVEWRVYQRTSGPMLSLSVGTSIGLLLSARTTTNYLPEASAGELVASIEAGLVSLVKDRPARLDAIALTPMRAVGTAPAGT